jgi:pilus assembly protein CpaB
MRLRALIFLGLAIALAGVAAYLVNQMLSTQPPAQVAIAPAPQIETRDTVVTTLDLPVGTQLDSTHLRVVQLPLNTYPANSYTSIDDALANPPVIVLSPLTTGEVVLPTRLSTGLIYRGITGRIPEGKRGVSIPVSAVRGVGGFVLPGDRVDVLHTTSVGRRDDQPVTRTLLQDLTVLAIDQTSSESYDVPTLVNVVTLLTTQEEAKTLILALEVGSLTLTLRNELDDGEDDSRTIALNNLWSWGPEDLGLAPGQQGSPSPPPRPRVAVIRGLSVNEETVAAESSAAAAGQAQ